MKKWMEILLKLSQKCKVKPEELINSMLWELTICRCLRKVNDYDPSLKASKFCVFSLLYLQIIDKLQAIEIKS